MRSTLHSFIIWGHGLKYKKYIIDTIASGTHFKILKTFDIDVYDIKKFVHQIYSMDFVPIEHLKGKTKYLLKTPKKICLIVVINYHPNELFFGEGSFRHKQDLHVKRIKEIIRNKYNPYIDNKRTEYHVIHATDIESQVEKTLKACNLHYTLEDLKLVEMLPIKIPIHISPFKKFKIISIPIDKISISLNIKYLLFFRRTVNVNVKKSPHYKYLMGDKISYLKYISSQSDNTDPRSNEIYNSLIKTVGSRKYLSGKYLDSYILVKKTDSSMYQVLDGAHRISILAWHNIQKVTVVEVIYD